MLRFLPSIFPTHSSFQSEKNGRIDVYQQFGSSTVRVNGFSQTSPYLQKMMRSALQKLPQSFAPKSVLLCGLAAGIAVYELERAFPNAEVMAIEWDPVMVTIAKKYGKFSKQPSIQVGDMFEILPKLEQQFDLIIIDVFFGNMPDARLTNSKTVGHIRRLMGTKGYMLLNVFETEEIITTLAQYVKLTESWVYRYNHLALFTS